MNILIMGVPRSGTSILADMINKLGWNFAPDANWCGESRYIEEINKWMINTKIASNIDILMKIEEVKRFAKKQQTPWVIKSPSFCYTLKAIRKCFDDFILIAIRKPQDKLEESWHKLLGTKVKEVDGELIDAGGQSLSEWSRMLQKSYAEYTGPKVMLDYDKLTEAVKLLDLGRATR
jgi:hypothetical protein